MLHCRRFVQTVITSSQAANNINILNVILSWRYQEFFLKKKVTEWLHLHPKQYYTNDTDNFNSL